MNIVILAAGLGKRMGTASVASLPKVLYPVAGRPMLAHVLDAVRAAVTESSANIIIVVGHAGHRVQEAFPELADMRYVQQSPQLGTGHAVLQALPLLDDASRRWCFMATFP